MTSQTAIALAIVALAVLALAWRAYKALKSSACCGSCGCNLMSKKAKKQLLKKRQSTANSDVKR